LTLLATGAAYCALPSSVVLKVTTADKIFIVTNGKYLAQVMEHLPELEANQVLCEPSRNNTARPVWPTPPSSCMR
jgi:mannose-1-phosphate guanylyltransferase